jgi:hypothetical protein
VSSIDPESVALVFRLFLRSMRTKSRRPEYRRAREEFGKALMTFVGMDDWAGFPEGDTILDEDYQATELAWAKVVAAARRLEAEFARIEEGRPGPLPDDLRRLLGDDAPEST